MDTKLINKITSKYKTVKHPDFKVGDVVEVHSKIKEGDKERIQAFKGIVIAKKNQGVNRSFTVRKISYGIGVEKIFPHFSPNIIKIKIIKQGNVKTSKLYYLRQRIGKLALKAGVQIPAEGDNLETEVEKEAEPEKAAEDKSEEKKSAEKEGEAKSQEKENSKKGEVVDSSQVQKESDQKTSPEKLPEEKSSQ